MRGTNRLGRPTVLLILAASAGMNPAAARPASMTPGQGIAFAFPFPTSKAREQETPSAVLVHRPGRPAIPTEIPDLKNQGSASRPRGR